jgi:hypothetical protein
MKGTFLVDGMPCVVEIHHQFNCYNPFEGSKLDKLYFGAEGFIVVSGLRTYVDHFSLLYFIDEIRKIKKTCVPIVFALHKVDLFDLENALVTKEVHTGLALCKSEGLPIFETSAKDCAKKSVESLFYNVIKYIRYLFYFSKALIFFLNRVNLCIYWIGINE